MGAGEGQEVLHMEMKNYYLCPNCSTYDEFEENSAELGMIFICKHCKGIWTKSYLENGA